MRISECAYKRMCVYAYTRMRIQDVEACVCMGRDATRWLGMRTVHGSATLRAAFPGLHFSSNGCRTRPDGLPSCAKFVSLWRGFADASAVARGGCPGPYISLTNGVMAMAKPVNLGEVARQKLGERGSVGIVPRDGRAMPLSGGELIKPRASRGSGADEDGARGTSGHRPSPWCGCGAWRGRAPMGRSPVYEAPPTCNERVNLVQRRSLEQPWGEDAGF